MPSPAGGSESIAAIRQLSDGRIIAAGTRRIGGTTEGFVLRLLADGTRDTTFGTDGIFPLTFAAVVQVRSVAQDAMGRILVGGSAGQSEAAQSLFVARVGP